MIFMPKPPVKYLLLDINDVTNVCGSIWSDELSKLLKIKPIYLPAWLCHNGVLEGKYYVVEDV